MKSTRRGRFSVHRSEKTPGSKSSSTSGLSPRGHLERKAEFHASTQDEACLSWPQSAGTQRSESEIRGTLRFLPQLEMRPSSNAPSPGPDRLVAMPLHPRRIRERGFNHATEIAREVATRLGLALDTTSCQRIRDTPPQMGLKHDERRRNLRGAFACSGEVRGQRIALIDDVMTTGTSLDELAKTLKRAGAAVVETWVVARTLPPGDAV